MQNHRLILSVLFTLSLSGISAQPTTPVPTSQVIVKDAFWTPLLNRMNKTTVMDVLDKFEGRHVDEVDHSGDNFWSPDRDRVEARKDGEHNALRNFDLVAQGHVADGGHHGFPWFDGLIYESITGISDYLLHYPDAGLVHRLDDYVDRIAAAQAADPNGYINTYTTLQENDHRWGEHGGNLRWQHDVYNSGCLVEAGVHYYIATGKTKLLAVATRLANYMYDYMVAPNHNLVPGHALPEDALLQLYQLYKEQPKLAKKVGVPVFPEHYRRLAEFWIEQRGHTDGRRPLEAYAQDHQSVFDMQTIEGHAVRATLFATGVASAAIQNGDARYVDAAHRLWNNMVGKRMFITGGVGAIHEDEKFGPDYFLPNNAYLETCAAIGAGLFSLRMNQLTGDGQYMDVVERVLYNSVPTAVSLSGDHYTYQNPLNADNQNRWPWHDCPCCPPMVLKMTGAMPGMIYAYGEGDLYVNLLVGSSATLQIPGVGKVKVIQQVDWENGCVKVQVGMRKKSHLRVHVRVPGWSYGQELPLELYHNDVKAKRPNMKNGYAVYEIQGGNNEIEVNLNMQPRRITADKHVEQLSGMQCLAYGPWVYCVERVDNPGNWNQIHYQGMQWQADWQNYTLDNMPVLHSVSGGVTAIPYYLIANREKDTSYRVWLK